MKWWSGGEKNGGMKVCDGGEDGGGMVIKMKGVWGWG